MNKVLEADAAPLAGLADEAGLRAALRALPLEESLDTEAQWQQLAARLRHARRRRQVAPIWAMAAALALAAIGLSLWRSVPSAGTQTLAQLQQQSQQLEARLAGQRQNGRYSLRAAELEQSLADGLALTDLKLSASRDESESIELWQRRVALLSTWLDLGAIGAEVTSIDPSAAAARGSGVSPQTAADEEPWL